jgi:hypothetical protein
MKRPLNLLDTTSFKEAKSQPDTFVETHSR